MRQRNITDNFGKLELEGPRLATYDEADQYRIYLFDTHLAPGETVRLDFTSQVWRRGFVKGTPPTDVIGNGTFVKNLTFASTKGMDRASLLNDRTKRRRQGQPDELCAAKLEDTEAQIAN